MFYNVLLWRKTIELIGGLSAGSHTSGYETTSVFASFWIALDSIHSFD